MNTPERSVKTSHFPQSVPSQDRRTDSAADALAPTRGEAFARDGEHLSVTRRPSPASITLFKRLAAATAACASLLAVAVPGAAPAATGSITYVKDNQVWITDPDGTFHRQLTESGTDAEPFRSPSQTDAGVVYTSGPSRAFYRLDHTGEYAASPLVQPGCLGGPPATDAQVQPNGGRIALSYVSTCNDVSPRATSIDANTTAPDEGDNPFFEGYRRPRWISPTHYAMVATDGHSIEVEAADHKGAPRDWIGLGTNPDTGEYDSEIVSFDVDRTGRYSLIEVASLVNGPTQIYLWDDKGAIPNEDGGPVCVYEVDAGNGFARPRFSPDGKHFVYSGRGGVHVANRLQPGGPDGSCLIPPDNTIAPEGYDADWGKKDLAIPTPPPVEPKPPVDPPPPPPTNPGNGNQQVPPPNNNQQTPPANNNNQQPPTDSTAPVANLTAKGGKLKNALKKGHAISVSCDEACSIDAQLVQPGKKGGTFTVGRAAAAKDVVVASGKGSLKKAGTAKLKLKFTKKAMKSLKKKKSVKLTLQVTVTDAAGNVATKTAQVSLKR